MDIGIILKTMLKRFEELTGLRRFKPEKKIDFSWIIEGARKLFNKIFNADKIPKRVQPKLRPNILRHRRKERVS